MSDPIDNNEDTFLPQSDRLQILSPEEYELLWGVPRFSQYDRDLFFALTAPERHVLARLRTVRTKAHFLLQLGYFRARQRFFRVEVQSVGDDIEYLSRRYLDNAIVADIDVSDHTRKRHVALILKLFRYRLCEKAERLRLEERAVAAARISSRPVYVLRDLVDHMRQTRIVLPGYTYLQDLVRRALTFERHRISGALNELISDDDMRLLARLLKDDKGLHAITSIKHQPRDFSHKQLLGEIQRGQQIRDLFAVARRVIDAAGLSTESVRYYASLVDYYTVYKLKRMSTEMVHLYLLCFIQDRYQRLNDNLLSAFCALVSRYADEATAAAKEAVYRHRVEANDDLTQGAKILELFLDESISDETPFSEVRQRANRMLPADRLARLCEHLVDDAGLDELAYEWRAIDRVMAKAKRNIRPLLRFIALEGTAANGTLLKAFRTMSRAFRDGLQLPLSDLPTTLIPQRSARYLVGNDGNIVRDRYEFVLYRQLRERLEAGDLYCPDSARYRSFEDDLVDEHTYGQRHTLLPQLGLVNAETPIGERLEALRVQLNERFDRVNQSIRDGDNAFVRWRQGKAIWDHGRHTQEPLRHDPFFDTIERTDIDNLLLYVDRRTDFMAAFEHVLGRYQRGKAAKPITVACLMAYATNIGLGRMAEISNLTYQQLSTTAANFIRLETLREANERIASATARLPIFRHFDIGEAVHSSSDGQKFEAAIPTINARHSAKYFGLKKGVVAYTLLASHVPLNARIIGANEHESHYVFDVLFNNATDIVPDTHSTDTHGTNQVNFALLHLFGYRFAPRYRDFRRKIESGLYGFKHPSQYRGCPIKPVRKIKESLIVSEWPNIERILLSLALKTTTQSVIVSKLSAFQRKNKTKQALWEFDNIIKSLFMLDYVDSPALRRNVQKALNRGESYHQLRSAIAYAHGGRFRVRSQHEQNIWNECARLIANAVVYYNSLILSEVLGELESQQALVTAEDLKRISPLAWQHINFYGRYQFDSDTPPVDIAEIGRRLASNRLSTLPNIQTH
ncbi:MAG: Tn3 family transposase [Proteobacteria bacterium]|nr:Tn3 family transposase [Pseudomonadota bacterium]